MDSERLRKGEVKLMKKGHGCIIHVSDFIKEDNGQLIIRNDDGIIIKDA